MSVDNRGVELPQKYLDFVGTKQKISGYVFSSTKELDVSEYNVLDIRRGTSKIVDVTTLKVTNLTFQLKLKNSTMKRAQWSKPFADLITAVNDNEL